MPRDGRGTLPCLRPTARAPDRSGGDISSEVAVGVCTSHESDRGDRWPASSPSPGRFKRRFRPVRAQPPLAARVVTVGLPGSLVAAWDVLAHTTSAEDRKALALRDSLEAG